LVSSNSSQIQFKKTNKETNNKETKKIKNKSMANSVAVNGVFLVFQNVIGKL
jgi:uncharacterized membrane protein YjfL (UPF0719 family)